MDKGKICEELLTPVSILAVSGMENEERLLTDHGPCVPFKSANSAKFVGKGSYVCLDFGREIAGSIRIISSFLKGDDRLHIRLGESASEALAPLGTKGACNDHSPRDIEVDIASMSDLTFCRSGFRFAYIESLGDNPLLIQNIYAVLRTEKFSREGYIKTNDEEINRILETAAYTMKLCCQNGYIWDGIKRDRLVWAGDLHQEVLTSGYLFGDIENTPNSLTFLKNDTADGAWMNWIPSYSAWWVINLCEYRRLTGNTAFFNKNAGYAKSIIKRINKLTGKDGSMNYAEGKKNYFLDWPTRGTDDEIPGTAAIMMIAAEKLFNYTGDKNCAELVKKLSIWLSAPCTAKQTKAMQVLAGAQPDAAEFIENGGAHGFSTFMSYYILSAYAMCGGTKVTELIKEYFGAMLSRGATTFWEDFNLDWLEGSGRIDEIPNDDVKDLHGDYGAFCYKGFRHSLCHGWSSGVYSFFVEKVLGVKIEDGKVISVTPNTFGLTEVEAEIPVADGILKVKIKDGKKRHYIKKI